MQFLRLEIPPKRGTVQATPRQAKAAGIMLDVNVEKQLLGELADSDSLCDVILQDVPFLDVPLPYVPFPNILLPAAHTEGSVGDK
jgi:hypothetical protein